MELLAVKDAKVFLKEVFANSWDMLVGAIVTVKLQNIIGTVASIAVYKSALLWA